MPAPTIDPQQRRRTEVASADTYLPNDPVWVYLDGGWVPGVVEFSTDLAVTVTFLLDEPPGTGVHIRTACYVIPRAEDDPAFDSRVAKRLRGVQQPSMT